MRRSVLIPVLVFVATLLAAGTAFAVSKQCNGGEYCKGTPTADKLYGSSRGETIFGLEGNDQIYGGGGADTLKGSTGTDFLKDGGGDNIFTGGVGLDVVRAGAVKEPNDGANDEVDCGGGTDTVYFTPGEDTTANCEVLRPTR